MLPGLLVHTSWRARGALLELGEPTPGLWGGLGYVAFGVHLAGGAAAVGLFAAEDDNAGIAAAVSFAGYVGAIGSGVMQWTVDRRHARAIGLRGPDAEAFTARMPYVPLFAVAGRF